MEKRSGADFFFDRSDKVDVAADAFSEEVLDLIQENAVDNKRHAVDKIVLHGFRALDEKRALKLQRGGSYKKISLR